MKKLRLYFALFLTGLPAMLHAMKEVPRDLPGRVPRDMAIIVNFPEKPILIPLYPSFWNFWTHVLDFNNDSFTRVGHTGVILVDGATGDLQYYDFGRYDDRNDLHGPRPEFYGTVRSVSHVPDLDLKLKASLKSGWVTNLDTILVHLGAKKIFRTYGKIDYSVVYHLDLSRMLMKAKGYEGRGFIYYGAPTHLYCTRFVREVIRAGGSSFGIFTFTGTQTVNYVKRQWGS